MQEFERQAKTQKHERRYLEKLKNDKNMQREDLIERRKHNNEVEFDDYRKSIRDGGNGRENGKRLKKI
jgi:hypothetical protein